MPAATARSLSLLVSPLPVIAPGQAALEARTNAVMPPARHGTARKAGDRGRRGWGDKHGLSREVDQ